MLSPFNTFTQLNGLQRTDVTLGTTHCRLFFFRKCPAPLAIYVCIFIILRLKSVYSL